MADEDTGSGIPGFQSMMLPLLRSVEDGRTKSSAELRSAVAEHFSLSPAQLAELVPSGTQPVFNNRVTWASVYLQRAGLLERPSRGNYRIAVEGQKVLKDDPQRIDLAFLMKYPSIQAFRGGKVVVGGTPEERAAETPAPPRRCSRRRISRFDPAWSPSCSNS